MIPCSFRGKAARFAIVVVALGMLGACDVNLPDNKMPEIDYTSRMPYEINVGQLEIVNSYNAPGRAPNIDHQMGLSPESELKRWAQSRLQPMGTEGSGRYTILDASMTETPVKTESGIDTLFKKQAIARYDVSLRVTLQILDATRAVKGEVTASSKHYRTILEGATVHEREKAQAELLKNAMGDIDAQMDKGVRGHLQQWLIR